MSMEGLFGLIILIIMGLITIILPFFNSQSALSGSHKHQLQLTRDELITSYERVLSTLRDLEDDYKSQKISSADYEQEHTYWSQYGVRLLELLDGQIQDQGRLSLGEDDKVLQLDRSVEEAIRNYRVALQSVEKS